MVRKAKGNTQDIVIVVMGPTGPGKSNFINKLTGSKEEFGADGLKSCTQGIREFTVYLPVGKRYVFVDTPGFDDTYRSDRDILRTIADWLEKKYRGDLKLAGVIYTHRISDNRMSGSVCKNLDLFSQLCGDGAAQFVRLVTTMWDNQKQENKAAWQGRVSQLEKHFWEPLISLGARHVPFSNTQKSAWGVVDGLVQARNPTDQGESAHATRELDETSAGNALLIQEEMVDAQKKLNETSVGKALHSRIQRLLLAQKYMLKDLADALAEKDPNARECLCAEQRKAEAEMQKLKEDMERMKIPFGRQIALFFGGRKTHSRKIELNIVPGLLLDDFDYGSCEDCEDPAQTIPSVGVGTLSPFQFTANDYVIFVVGPVGPRKRSFVKKLVENRDIPVVQIEQHVEAWKCNPISGPASIVVISIPSLRPDHEVCGGDDMVINWLQSR